MPWNKSVAFFTFAAFISLMLTYFVWAERRSYFFKVENLPAPTWLRKNTTNFLRLRRFKGGLANHMFEAAASLGLAIKNGKQLSLPHSPKLAAIFPRTVQYMISKLPTLPKKVTCPPEQQFQGFSKNISDCCRKAVSKSVEIEGYLQSWRYWFGKNRQISELFEIKDSIKKSALTIIQKHKANSSLLVAVHVRRGDFGSGPSKNMGFRMAPKAYFVNAMRWMRKKLHPQSIRFYVLGNSRPWNTENVLGDDVIQGGANSAAVDLAIMNFADHVVASVGTYSWFGGWLGTFNSPKLVTYYNHPYEKGRPMYNNHNSSDHFPANWIPLGDS